MLVMENRGITMYVFVCMYNAYNSRRCIHYTVLPILVFKLQQIDFLSVIYSLSIINRI